MEIIIVGCGKVGNALAVKLMNEGHSITMIDTNAERIHDITEDLDVMGIVGNGSSITTLTEAGLEDTDVLIAVTGSDELNLLCCMFAKKVGHCNAIARVRNPMYSRELDFIKQQLGISSIINPELTAAEEISRLLRFPVAMQIDTFADDKVRLIKFQLTERQQLDNIKIKDIPSKIGGDILICAIERGHEVVIPDGEFVIKCGDVLTILATRENAVEFFGKINLPTKPVKNALIVGGGTMGYYLAKDLIAHNIKVRIIEQNGQKCENLAELLPEATIIHGDGTDRELLMAEGLNMAEAFVSLTNLDEENVFLSMFAKKHSNAKIVTKVNRIEFDDILDGLDIGSSVYPKYITCDFILQYVRALQNKSGNNIKTLYKILDDRVEALEFTVHKDSAVTSAPLSELRLKPNQLICCINRNDKIIIPRGNDKLQIGDTVIVVTFQQGLQDVRDIVDN